MFKKTSSSGFTLLEVLVTLSLLLIIFGGAISLIILVSQSERGNKNNLIAAYLAKEGWELVRYTRDLNYIHGDSPFNNLATTTEGGQLNIVLDADDNINVASLPDVKKIEPLKVDTGRYLINGTTNSIFKRLITTTYHEATLTKAAYIDVLVEVYWQDDNQSNTYTITNRLIDWR